MSKKQIPEIRINFSWLLYEDISKRIFELKDWKLPSGEQCEEWTEAYRKAWSKQEKIILKAMQEITGLTFYRNVIDITTAPGIISKSEPMLLSFIDRPSQVIDTITHELLHVLLCDNTTLSIYGRDRNFKLGSEWRKLFGFKDDFNALVHVPVFAVQKKIFEDCLKDKDFVARDKKLMKKFGATSYLKAWDYVEKEGADVVIKKLKKFYTEIAKKLEKKK